jgi:SAM-dependent methyltransferase
MTSLRWHPAADVPTEAPPDLKGATHRSRVALEQLLADPDNEPSWDILAESYAEMAAEWREWAVSQQQWYDSPVRVGLLHTKPVSWALEVGCGTGEATAPLAEHAPTVVSTDVNLEMISRALRPANARFVAADVRSLPLRDSSVPLLAGLNAVPHIKEFNRVITPDGQLLWCTSFGAGTPLYVEPERLLHLFGPGWVGEAGHAGHGEWMVLSRIA